MKRKKNKQTIAFTIDVEIIALVKEKANESGLSASWIVNNILKENLVGK